MTCLSVEIPMHGSKLASYNDEVMQVQVNITGHNVQSVLFGELSW